MNAELFDRKFVPKGKMVMRQGDEGHCAYLVQSGRVLVYSEKGQKTIELAKLDAGQIFGEMALICDDKRAASVKTLEDTNLIVITRDAFEYKLDRSDPTIRAIVKMMTDRILNANNNATESGSNTQNLMDTCRNVYMNVLAGLPESQKKTFENAVQPKLEAFLETLQSFEQRFKRN